MANLEHASEVAIAQLLDRLKLVDGERALLHLPLDVLASAIIRLAVGLVARFPVLALAILRAVEHCLAHTALLAAGLTANGALLTLGRAIFRFHHLIE